MANGGVTMMLYGESDRGPEEVVHEALNHPLLDVDISGATGVLIHVTGGQYMTLEAASQVVDLLTARVSEDANVIWGARQDAGFGDNQSNGDYYRSWRNRFAHRKTNSRHSW